MPCSCGTRCWTTAPSSAGTPRRCASRPATSTGASWPRPRAATGLDESVLTGEGTRLRAPRGGGGLRVRLPGRLDRGGRRRTDHRRRAAGDRRAAAAAGLAELGRHPHAGGHRRVPADGQDRRGRRAAQARASALPGVPAPPHHRRGVRVVGLARATSRSPSRARSIGFLGPRVYEHLYGEPFPVRHSDRGEPAAARRHRRRGPARARCAARWTAR